MDQEMADKAWSSLVFSFMWDMYQTWEFQGFFFTQLGPLVDPPRCGWTMSSGLMRCLMQATCQAQICDCLHPSFRLGWGPLPQGYLDGLQRGGCPERSRWLRTGTPLKILGVFHQKKAWSGFSSPEVRTSKDYGSHGSNLRYDPFEWPSSCNLLAGWSDTQTTG